MVLGDRRVQLRQPGTQRRELRPTGNQPPTPPAPRAARAPGGRGGGEGPGDESALLVEQLPGVGEETQRRQTRRGRGLIHAHTRRTAALTKGQGGGQEQQGGVEVADAVGARQQPVGQRGEPVGVADQAQQRRERREGRGEGRQLRGGGRLGGGGRAADRDGRRGQGQEHHPAREVGQRRGVQVFEAVHDQRLLVLTQRGFDQRGVRNVAVDQVRQQAPDAGEAGRWAGSARRFAALGVGFGFGVGVGTIT